jgi:hypothetical protein
MELLLPLNIALMYAARNVTESQQCRSKGKDSFNLQQLLFN